MRWWWSRTSTRSWWQVACCAGAEAPPANALLEKVVSGGAIVALAAAEPGSGESWHDVSTVADRDGDEWVFERVKIVRLRSGAVCPRIC